MSCCSGRNWALYLAILGVLLIVLGIVSVTYLEPNLLDWALPSLLLIAPSSSLWNDFVQPEPPVYLDVYLWNVENVDQFLFDENAGI